MSVKDEWLRVIARAWKDPDFRDRLRADPKATLEDENIRAELNLNDIYEDGVYFPLGNIPEDQQDKTEAELVELLQENSEQLFGEAFDKRGVCF